MSRGQTTIHKHVTSASQIYTRLLSWDSMSLRRDSSVHKQKWIKMKFISLNFLSVYARLSVAESQGYRRMKWSQWHKLFRLGSTSVRQPSHQNGSNQPWFLYNNDDNDSSITQRSSENKTLDLYHSMNKSAASFWYTVNSVRWWLLMVTLSLKLRYAVSKCKRLGNVTDRQTDRQTDDMRSQDRALHCSASRGKSFARSYRWQTGRRCREVRRKSRWCRRWCLLYCDHLARRCQSCHRSSSSEIQSSLQQTVNSKQLPRSVTRHKSDERISDGLANEDQGRDISFVKVQVCYSIQHFISISDLWWR